ncbi:hypothetical protein [Paenibacillus amylolyticus]|nr:hypothetical protein [Paenibacillus amylolyticus]
MKKDENDLRKNIKVIPAVKEELHHLNQQLKAELKTESAVIAYLLKMHQDFEDTLTFKQHRQYIRASQEMHDAKV